MCPAKTYSQLSTNSQCSGKNTPGDEQRVKIWKNEEILLLARRNYKHFALFQFHNNLNAFAKFCKKCFMIFFFSLFFAALNYEKFKIIKLILFSKYLLNIHSFYLIVFSLPGMKGTEEHMNICFWLSSDCQSFGKFNSDLIFQETLLLLRNIFHFVLNALLWKYTF